MAIPISEYIDITTKVQSNVTGSRDFSGLVVTIDAINTGDSHKTDYDAGKVISLTASEVNDSFGDDTYVKAFAAMYFGAGARILNIVKRQESETALVAYNRIISEFQNFGSISFLGATNTWVNGTTTSGGLIQVATQNQESGYLLVVPTTTANRATDAAAFADMKGCHVVQDAITTIREASTNPTVTAITANLGAAMVQGWYGSVDYSLSNESSSIDYKTFGGAEATVTTLSDKRACDKLNVNYVGLVQAHGFQRKFYQQGKNMDGVDIGVFRDAMWIKGEVEAGWFNLVGSATKIPANETGAAMVRAMVIDVAERGLDNGVILVEKPLTDTQITLANNEADDADAASSIMSVGYYVATDIILENDGRYTCRYLLEYAKGDHIGKVVGTHYLV